MKRVLLIYNPNAGNGVIKNHLDTVIGAFAETGMQIVPYRLGESLSADRALAGLPEGEYEKIIAAGGDGTVNSVVSAMIRNGVHLPLAIFPTGTANDLASNLGIPLTIEGMIETALSDDYIGVDVGKAGSKYFVNVLAIGMLVDISQRTDPMIKNTLGLGAYYLRTLAEVPFARPFRLRIVSDEQTIDEDVSIVLVMNGRTAGGFKGVAPYSDVGDGLLDVLVVRKLILPTMLPALLSVLTGQHLKDKRFYYFHTARLHIEHAKGEAVPTDVDGERGDPLPQDVEVLPNRLMINVHKGLEAFTPPLDVIK